MATQDKTVVKLQSFGDDVWICTWDTLGADDDGTPFEMPGASDRSIQITGNYSAAATCAFQGTNDGVTWFALNDPGGASINASGDLLRQVLELTRWVRPFVSGGDGSTAIDAVLLVRRSY